MRILLSLALCLFLIGCREVPRKKQSDDSVIQEPFPLIINKPDPAVDDTSLGAAGSEPIVVSAPENVVDAVTQILGGEGRYPFDREMVIEAGKGAKVKIPPKVNFTYKIQADGSYLFVFGRPKPEASVDSMKWLIEPPIQSVLLKRNNTGLAKVELPGGLTHTHKFKLDWNAVPEEAQAETPAPQANEPAKQPEAAVEKPKFTVVFVTDEEHCAPCKIASKTTIPGLKAAGVEVKVIDATKADLSVFDVELVPTFLLYDGEVEIGRVVGQNPVIGDKNSTLDEIVNKFKTRKK